MELFHAFRGYVVRDPDGAAHSRGDSCAIYALIYIFLKCTNILKREKRKTFG